VRPRAIPAHGRGAPVGWDGGGGGHLGMRLFVLSLGVFFLAAIVLFLVLSHTSSAWSAARAVRLPHGLWVSTGLLLASSITVWRAGAAARTGRRSAAGWALVLTMVLGAGFLASQVVNWLILIAEGAPMRANLLLWMFYTFTGMHLAHVLGGLVPLAMLTRRMLRAPLTPSIVALLGHCGLYWHFVDAVWLVMVLGLFFPG
jgi:heme/copper-type cytochrome/quinol oxidase subunit 3